MELLDVSVKLNVHIEPDELVTQAEYLYDLVKDAKPEFLTLDDVDIHIWVEQGSLSKRAKLYIALGTFINVVADFDGFMSGLERIYNYSIGTANYIVEKATTPTPDRILEVKKSTGFPGKIANIMRGVHKGKYSPEEATARVLDLIESEEADEAQKELFISEFSAAAKVNYRKPLTQLTLFALEDLEGPKTPGSKNKRKSRSPKQESSLQGIEIWYDRKTGRKQVKRYTK